MKAAKCHPLEASWREVVLMGKTFRIWVPPAEYVPDGLHFLRGNGEEGHDQIESCIPCHCSWVSLFFVSEVRHTYSGHHISSISPLSTPSLTSLHRNTQRSPRFSSTVPAPCSPCTSTCPASLSIRQKTALSSSGLSIILIPPAVSSSFRKPAGNDERNAVL